MDKIADSIIDLAGEWSKNHESRAAVVIVGDMKTDLSSALLRGSNAQIKAILMNSMLRERAFARCVIEVAADYDEVVSEYSQMNA